MANNNDIMNLIAEGKIKRYFSAKHKIDVAECISHITQRAVGADVLFLEDSDYLRFIDLMKNVSSKYNFEIFAFALMNNHVHLLLRQHDDTLSDGMKILFMNYAKYFNFKYERKGHVFCGRYRQSVCFDDAYLLASSLYIHLNPVRARLVSNYEDYKWTSLRLYVNPSNTKSFVNQEYILQIIDNDISKAQEKYKRMLIGTIKKEFGDVLEESKGVSQIRNNISRIFPEIIRRCLKNEEDSKLEENILKLFNGKIKKDKETTRKKKYIVEQLKSRGFTASEIADKLAVTRQHVYSYLTK